MRERAAPPVLLLCVVGLTPRLLAHAPRLRALADAGALASLEPPLPAVTSTSQATMLTGAPPAVHGIVANGWYFRELAEVWFWRQSNRLLQGEQLWQAARRVRPRARLAKLFWWFNMYAPVDLAVTVRPHYPADGRKIPGIYTEPPELERELEERLGPFPLFRFWGPAADLASSRWIAEAALAVWHGHRPDLMAVYLPHLDYDAQRYGPDDERVLRAVGEVDRLAGALVEVARAAGGAVLVVSEYGLEPVRRALHPNRALREAGLLRVRASRWTGELLDAGASRAFAVCDHQIAHVYVRDPQDLGRVREVLGRLEGVAEVWGAEQLREAGLGHPRAGELVLLAAPDAWFAYPYWLDEACAPDFARTVDIHRKPGFDPLELWLEPGVRTRLRLAWRLVQKALGMRYLMDVIARDERLVGGSHGLVPSEPERGPLVIGWPADLLPAGRERLPMGEVKALVLRALARERALA
ncbi:MAG: alkaline phosphatase family protein [Planctomycetota bacterium]|nr:MAG: alkaline phosphatase family protein [Planctomycetota bacterium]